MDIDTITTAGSYYFMTQDQPTSIYITSNTSHADNCPTFSGYSNSKIITKLDNYTKVWTINTDSTLYDNEPNEPLDSKYISKIAYTFGPKEEYKVNWHRHNNSVFGEEASSTTGTWFNVDSTYVPVNPNARLRQIIQMRIAPVILGRRTPLHNPQTKKEVRARTTLRWLIGEQEFRRLLKHGFISVQSPSGLVYCISPGHTMAKVYKNGKFIERLCVQLAGDFPPTDALLMRYLLILNDEEYFRAKAIRHERSGPAPARRPGYLRARPPAKATDKRPLVEIYEELKFQRKFKSAA